MPEPQTVHPWLAQFPPEAQVLVIAWFHYAMSQRPQTPDGLLAIVERLIGHKLDWSTTTTTREACHRTLLALTHQRAGARSYAATLLSEFSSDGETTLHGG